MTDRRAIVTGGGSVEAACDGYGLPQQRFECDAGCANMDFENV